MKANLKSDPDYMAAWRACLKPIKLNILDGGHEKDLRALLDAAFENGWTGPALRAYAWTFQNERYDHLTQSAWRYAVWLADTGIGAAYLEHFNRGHQGPQRIIAGPLVEKTAAAERPARVRGAFSRGKYQKI